ncbi:MAG: TIGR03905 family TSCPD domain-containing protein [Clostridia bacterium]|nr:TIGR03905 family TSCPD domain-containing protein [Clostridia bacterium]
MTKHIEYKTRGTCSRMIVLDVEDGVITNCKFVGGCAGNTQGVAALVKGMTTEEAIARLKGIRCGFKPTSCPDQLAVALMEAVESN